MLNPTRDAQIKEYAWYMIEHEATVRETALVFRTCKTTVHKNITEELYDIDYILAEEVRKVLDKNKAERHLRGGEATRRKHELLNLQKEMSSEN